MSDALYHLLRTELTAVNQQFTHILVLQAQRDKETAAQIQSVDDVDFSNAMRIINYLVEREIPVELKADRYVTGCSRIEMLQAERLMEDRMAAALASVSGNNPDVDALVAAATEPRAAYAAWLAREIGDAPATRVESGRFGAETFDLVAHILALMEQSLVHAFIHRHAGNTEAADASWMTSGAMMMHLTVLAQRLAREGSTPYPSTVPSFQIASTSGEALVLEQELSHRTRDVANRAAEITSHPKIATLCRKIADACGLFADWLPGMPHPDRDKIPRVFHSFAVTYDRFVAD